MEQLNRVLGPPLHLLNLYFRGFAISACTHSVLRSFLSVSTHCGLLYSQNSEEGIWDYTAGERSGDLLKYMRHCCLHLSNSLNLYNFTAFAGRGFFLIQPQWTVWVWILAEAQHISSTLWFLWMHAKMTISKTLRSRDTLSVLKQNDKTSFKGGVLLELDFYLDTFSFPLT